jgi:DNA-binding transcriptional MerR regulator
MSGKENSMKKRFRVGEVSKLFSIPQSTLRYYDEIGLFKPKYTDKENQYRYYTADQFVHLETIIFLRKIGLHIRDIQCHMEVRTPENTYELLQKKLTKVQQEMYTLEMTARKINHKLSTLENGMGLFEHQVVTYKTYPKRPVSFLYHDEPIDLNIDFEEIYVEGMNQEKSSSLNQGVFTGDIGAAVDPNSLYHDGPILYKSLFKLLWNRNLTEEDAYLPEGLYACYPHKGPYEDVAKSYSLLLNELNISGYKMIGAPIEIGIIDESVVKDQQHFVTEIEIPVQKKKTV